MSDELTEKPDRADKVLVALGHFDSRTAAQAAIAAGRVSVAGRVLRKPSEKISPRSKVIAEAAHPWVSRAGVKLAHALEVFSVDPSGLHCLDLGASTGGFTQVLLRCGAISVDAVDVGKGQIHPTIANDDRVRSLESTDARNLTAEALSAPPALIVCDASFISLSKLLGVPLSLAPPFGQLIALFKPQFEVGRQHVGKGGIVSDREATRHAEAAFEAWLIKRGWKIESRSDSPIKGSDGNAERLLHARRLAA